ncbi:hypothetical protein E8E11_006248 [Didymella keratinophila]|nr:hypothetical protein E8E11_006248 [Didymella keratinophila]
MFPLTADVFCYLQACGVSARSHKEQRYPARQFQDSAYTLENIIHMSRNKVAELTDKIANFLDNFAMRFAGDLKRAVKAENKETESPDNVEGFAQKIAESSLNALWDLD